MCQPDANHVLHNGWFYAYRFKHEVYATICCQYFDDSKSHLYFSRACHK